MQTIKEITLGNLVFKYTNCNNILRIYRSLINISTIEFSTEEWINFVNDVEYGS